MKNEDDFNFAIAHLRGWIHTHPTALVTWHLHVGLQAACGQSAAKLVSGYLDV